MPARTIAGALLGVLALWGAGSAAAKEVTIGYQLIYSPWGVPITQGRFEKETGYSIKWVKFDSGAKVSTAMASGDVQIGVMGSSPITATVSRGVDVVLFWILDDIAASEALVVRNGSGIDPKDPKTLIGKKIATPFVSTAHFHTLFALEVWGIDPKRVEVLNMQPNQIAAAWERGDIDAAYVWDPALARIKRNGQVMIDSAVLAEKGKPTFDGLVVSREWAEKNKDFMAKFVKIIAEADEHYRKNKAAWTPDSAEVKALVSLFGGEPADVPPSLALYGFPTLEEQASKKWLGGGKESGAARTLAATAEFLKAQGRIDTVLPDYSKFVTPAYVEAAMKLAK
ncbi:MAG: taurine ABC transporter substrate-binding protein [Geminicoccaceae bacterium]|nr:MAG: taurine ABC transporter substrate-binding protein [Geminicoccaceae bacterium]